MTKASPGKALFGWILVLSVVSLNACGPRPQDCADPKVFCAGLVTGFGGVTTGIEREAWLALQDAKAADLVDRIDRIETVDTRDRAANLEFMASNGYDVIVAVGAAMSAETSAAALRHPSLRFVGVEQPQDAAIANLAGLVFHEERSGFLAGVLAAGMSKTHHVAAVCEARYVDSIRRSCDGFRAGVAFGDPTVGISVIYREGLQTEIFQDTAWGTAMALSQVRQGADVVFAVGGETAVAALEAAAAQQALVIGGETDLYAAVETLHPKLLTCSLNYIREGVLDLVRRARENRFPGGESFGRVGLAPFHDLDALVPSAMRERLLQVEQALNDGSLQLDIAYDNPSD